MNRFFRPAYWLGPPLFCLVLYWPGLWAWFQQDDFAWLTFSSQVGGWQDFLRFLFEPKAQGTIRPLSERLFFLLFYGAFGLDALPFRAWVFLTQFANIALLSAITLRLTGSRLAGFLAPVFWIANAGLGKVMSWTSAYNQVLCGFFLLASFYLLIRFTETGQHRYEWGQWATFLLGFGALELNVVYPVLAAGFTFCRAPKYFWRTLPLFAPSLAYFVVYRWIAAQTPLSGPYGLHFDTAIPVTFTRYWVWALASAYSSYEPRWVAWLVAVLLTLALVLFIAARARRHDLLPLFLLGWFAVVITPFLPLREHVSDYYLALPTLGLAMLGAYACSRARIAGGKRAAAAAILAGAYLTLSGAATRVVTEWNYEQSTAQRVVVQGAARARQLHPGKVIILASMENELFWAGMFHKPFGLVSVDSVFLAPGSETLITAHPETGDPEDYIIPTAIALNSLKQDEAVVYVPERNHLRNVTPLYKRAAPYLWPEGEPKQVDVGQAVFADQLGPEWSNLREGHRWMPKTATVRLGGPNRAGESLHLTGYCHPSLLSQGPARMTVRANGYVLDTVILSQPYAFKFVLPLPPELLGRKSVEIEIELDRTFADPNEDQPLGVVFGTFVIR